MGTVTGYYDPDLTILSVSEPLLRGLGYTLDSFMARTGGSLRNMFYVLMFTKNWSSWSRFSEHRGHE